MKLLLTCDPGLEDIAIKEINEKIKPKKVEIFRNFQGKLLVETEKFTKSVFKLRSIHHVVILIKVFKIKKLDRNGLEEIYNKIKGIKFERFLKGKKSFRVTSQRVGNHEFTSVDVQRVAGQAIVENYKIKVNLKNYDINIRVDVFGHEVFVGIQLTKDSLYKRFIHVFNHPAGIKTTIAYGLLRLAEIKRGDVLLDPMCGGGTILLEAADLWRKKVKIIGGDISKRYLDGAKMNAMANNLEKYIKFINLDASKLDKYFPESSIDKIVTNPPYGIRMRVKKLKKLYEEFIKSAYKILKPNGRIVVLTVRAESFRIIVFRSRMYKIVHERVIESGGLFPHVFVLEKL